MKPLTVMLVAGEASGDNLGAGLAAALFVAAAAQPGCPELIDQKLADLPSSPASPCCASAGSRTTTTDARSTTSASTRASTP